MWRLIVRQLDLSVFFFLSLSVTLLFLFVEEVQVLQENQQQAVDLLQRSKLETG